MKKTILLLAAILVLASCQKKEDDDTVVPPDDPVPTYYPVEVTSVKVPNQRIRITLNGVAQLPYDSLASYYFAAFRAHDNDTIVVRTKISVVDPVSPDTGYVNARMWRVTALDTAATIATMDTAWRSITWVAGE